ncbi:MAG: hypothetical protein M1828_003277 [Chrysothrix sp. TS-e1954]|nr:MAG: hypothetical protein M1828_003277 [Chrysothrix sp. TS-e1954]
MSSLHFPMALNTTVEALQYLTPPLVAISWIGVLVVPYFTTKSQARGARKSDNEKIRGSQRAASTLLCLLITISYLADAVLYAVQYFGAQHLSTSESSIFCVAYMLLIWVMITVHNTAASTDILGPGSMVLLLQVSTLAMCASKSVRADWSKANWLLLSFGFFRILLIGLLLACPCCSLHQHANASNEERKPLLSSIEQPATVQSGPIKDDVQSGESPTDDEDDEDDEDAKNVRKKMKARLESSGGYWSYLKGFKIFVTFMIPKNNPLIQFCMVGVVADLLADRAFTVLVPLQLGIITDELANVRASQQPPYAAVGIWMLYKYLSGCVLSNVSSFAQMRIDNFTTSRIRVAAYAHFLNLDKMFHDDEKSTIVDSAVQYGEAVTDLLNVVIITIIPALIDVIVAFVYFYILFGPIFSFVAIYLSIIYIWLTILETTWTRSIQRKVVQTSTEEYEVMGRGLYQWPLVANFAGERREESGFAKAVETLQETMTSLHIRSIVMGALRRSAVATTQLVLGMVMALKIFRGELPVGSFVVLITYLGSLLGPLTVLADQYTDINSKLIHAERLLILFNTIPNIRDVPNARDLQVKSGRVVFKDVDFSYGSEVQTLRNINIEAEPGQTIGIVGATGSGKSTLLKLLCRYYDVKDGSIEIDSQDIRNVTQHSLRGAIGSVQQDNELFNETIMDNMKYARSDATDEEVYEACRAAAMHDKIMKFPKQYRNKVGERGAKVSGGELQRIAIAQAFLKRAPILVFDEATSSVDSQTEAQIRETLQTLCEGKTTFIIAHRFSTILRADKILVLDEGKIVEQGTHSSLIQLGGRYASLWEKQISQIDSPSDATDPAPK